MKHIQTLKLIPKKPWNVFKKPEIKISFENKTFFKAI